MLDAATDTSVAACPEPARHAAEFWKSYHVFYHGERDLQLTELVQPLVRDLLARGVIDRFFFIRYNLGGPHLRLRWRTLIPVEAERALELACRDFFQRFPSVATLTDQEIRGKNRSLISDPSETSEHDVFPNHSWDAFPTKFEVTRYGGEARFGAALDAFSLSSLTAMRVIDRLQNIPENKHRAHWLRALTGLAWGLAHDEDEFIALLGYEADFMSRDFDACRRAGDDLFERRGSVLSALLCSEMARPGLDETDPDDLLLFRAGRCVASTVADLHASDRRLVVASHLHMTANRLGLSNAEEVYLSRVLRRAGRQLEQQRPESWSRLWQWRAAHQAGDISSLTTAAMDRWANTRESHEE